MGTPSLQGLGQTCHSSCFYHLLFFFSLFSLFLSSKHTKHVLTSPFSKQGRLSWTRRMPFTQWTCRALAACGCLAGRADRPHVFAEWRYQQPVSPWDLSLLLYSFADSTETNTEWKIRHHMPFCPTCLDQDCPNPKGHAFWVDFAPKHRLQG